MLEIVVHWILLHGPLVIFALFAFGILGLPLPNEWLLAYLGFLLFKGRLHPVPTITAVLTGTLCGMTFNYAVGRTFGLYLVRRFGSVLQVTADRLQKVHDWFEHSGRWGLLFGYFLPGVRHLTALAAGASKMPFAEFALFGYTGAVAWAGVFLFFGYFFEEHWSRETERIHHVLLWGTAAAIAAGALYFLIKQRGKR